MPPDVQSLIDYSKFLRTPTRLLVDLHAKYPVILDAKFSEAN